jgi:cytochrome c oxidase subunit 2
LECIWTVLPALILIQVALPSLVLLYTLEESIFNDEIRVNLKVVGHQWYWNYSYPDLSLNSGDVVQYDSYITPTNLLNPGEFRLLEVDNRVVLPSLLPVRILITRADVLHAWTIPRLGVKADAVPGRLNQLNMQANIEGVFYGQCSEICGANHRFIPIVAEFIPFLSWEITMLGILNK